MNCVKKMTSKTDDTLSLPGYSQELSFDVTVDEDFIPPSQPQSTDGSKISKNSDTGTKKLKCSDDISDSNIAKTPPFKTVIDQSTLDWEESADFIPETETKKSKVNYVIEDFSCKKKLAVFNSEDIFKIQSDPTWNTDDSRIPESPALENLNFSILNDFPTKALSNQESVKKFEESVTEIIVNDSAETVDLEATPTKIKKSEGERPEEKLEISCSLNSDAERCEETQVFDNSSVLLLGQPGTVSLDLEKSEISEVASEKLYLQQTIDDNEADSQKKVKSLDLKFDPPPVIPELTKKSDTERDVVDVPRPKENPVLKKEIQLNSLLAEQTNASIVTRKIDFKLTVSCFVTLNTKTNKVLQKIISNVNEIPKSKPKPAYVENASDNTSDKSKRYSTSSSGSVYSDKMGLPFALPKRISAISDLTDSSEDEFGLLLKEERRALGRIPWSNEYLLPLKMDDIMQVSIEKEELLKRPIISSPRKPRNRCCDGANHLKEILESSSSEHTSSLCNSDTREPVKAVSSEEALGKETPENSEVLLTGKIEKPRGNLEEKVQNETETNKVVSDSERFRGEKEEETTSEPVVQKPNTESEVKLPDSAQEIKEIEKQTDLEGENTSIRFCDGLPVFARWTDKLYYSGILCGNVKNNRWDVKFDDGTLKAVREDFLMPVEWLKSGALVFVLIDDKCESGQIMNIKKGREEINYIVELDILKKEVSVKVSDLCLTDVMAGIVREKYKPLIGSPRGKAEIDFENVLSGKRLREHRTPLKPFTVQVGNSGSKKKSSSKTKKVGLKSLKEIPANTNPELLGGLKSENGHLLEDKVISADSPSGNEMVETPLRGKPKEPQRKVKPRSLSYALEETRLKKNWLASDGTPIPGPSGIKFKKQKTNAKINSEISIIKSTESPTTMVTRSSKKCHSRSKAPQSTEKGRRKRKFNESIEDDIQKKSLKEGGNKVNRKVKKK